MEYSLATTQEISDRVAFEAVIADWEYSLARAYGVALDHFQDDDLALSHVVEALDTLFTQSPLPPTNLQIQSLLPVVDQAPCHMKPASSGRLAV